MEIMDLKKMVPIVLYDDQCYLCIQFAKFVNSLTRGKVLLIGHYSELGEKIRLEILDSSALEMFWFIDGKTAFGGRAALCPLLKTIFSSKPKKNVNLQMDYDCEIGCKTTKSVFLRSASLLSNSKKISLKN